MREYIYEHKPSGADHMGKPVELPTLVQREEIVRCRDCEHNAKDTDGICYRFDYEHFNQPDGYCAWAKRRYGGDAE